MTRTGQLVAALAVFGGLGAGSFAAQSQYPGRVVTPRLVWEYRVVADPTPSMGATLNDLGADGWELVSAVTQDEYARNTRTTRTFYFLKRQVQPR